jgi:UDP-3-O-[3-hydroxymyristoyl] N-acetylglucosamine deacetylase
VESIAFHGRGLHSGARCSVELARRPGPVGFRTPYDYVVREALQVVRTDRGVKVTAPEAHFELELVEHLFAALGGLSVQEGISISIQGPEVPLQDGGAREFAAALVALGSEPTPPALHIERRGHVAVGDSLYEFVPEPQIHVSVEVAFNGCGAEAADWDGSAAQFLAEIAPARTFGFRADYDALRACGRAAFIDPHSVIVLREDGSCLGGAPRRTPGELARHKLLDLIGDLYLFGGPPLGRVRAVRPGHTATHRAVRVALAQGLLRRKSKP